MTQLNRGEGRHAVACVICHGQRGETIQLSSTVIISIMAFTVSIIISRVMQR